MSINGVSTPLNTGVSITGFSFLNRSRSISVGGPDEDYTSCEIQCHKVSGEVVGTAVVVEQIAFAGLSHVYKCYFSDGELEGTVAAAKILTTGYSHAGPKVITVLDRLYDREVTSLAKLNHPHVIGFYGVGEVEKQGNTRKVIFLEWMPGGDARALIDQAMRPMDEAAAGTIVLPLAEALGAAHSAGVVHRDVKAGNILLAPGVGQVRLADWGISVPVEEASSRMSLNGTRARVPGSIGTEFWCAPEIERGLPHDTSSDIFSLAITFIELITGRDPKYDNSEEGVRDLNLPDTGFVPSWMSQEAQDWVRSCLHMEPKQRPTVAQLLQHKFFTDVQASMDEAARAAAEADSEAEMPGRPAPPPPVVTHAQASAQPRNAQNAAASHAAARHRAAQVRAAAVAVGADSPRGSAPFIVEDASSTGGKQPMCGCSVM